MWFTSDPNWAFGRCSWQPKAGGRGRGLLLAALWHSRDAELSRRDEDTWLHPCERFRPVDSWWIQEHRMTLGNDVQRGHKTGRWWSLNKKIIIRIKWIFSYWSADISMKKGSGVKPEGTTSIWRECKDDWLSLPEETFDPYDNSCKGQESWFFWRGCFLSSVWTRQRTIECRFKGSNVNRDVFQIPRWLPSAASVCPSVSWELQNVCCHLAGAPPPGRSLGKLLWTSDPSSVPQRRCNSWRWIHSSCLTSCSAEAH